MYNLGSQGTFFARTRHAPDYQPFGSMDEGQLKSWVADRWYEAFEGKRAETERLKTCELFYAGFHYTDPYLNRINPVTNFCFSTVETSHPILTEDRPRPEARPRDPLRSQTADAVAKYADWKMDSTDWDRSVRLGTRDFLKLGWNIHTIYVDPATGLSIPRWMSTFDYYPDPTALNDSELEYYFIARPVSTRRLAALFPNALGPIIPDNIASPSYDVMVRPYFQTYKEPSRFDGPAFISASLFTTEAGGPVGGTSLVAGTGQHYEHGRTTFVLQMFVRDHGTMPVTYMGDRQFEDPNAGVVEVPHHIVQKEPCCPSGWRVISMTAGGTLLELPAQLDPAYGGMNITIARNHESGDHYYGPGELDNVIPLQRQYNRRSALLARHLELAANPPWAAIGNTGISKNQNSVDGGEIIPLRAGSDLKPLTFSGPTEQQFEHQAVIRTDMQIVSGAQDSIQGKRPAGIEAASAIRELQNAASVRIRGKAPVILSHYARLLEKCLSIDGRKAKDMIAYYAGGQFGSMDPEILRSGVDIRWAEGTGMVASRQDFQDRLLDLFDRGIVDAQYVVEMMDLPEGPEVVQRVQMMQAQQLAAQAAGAAKAPPPGGK